MVYSCIKWVEIPQENRLDFNRIKYFLSQIVVNEINDKWLKLIENRESIYFPFAALSDFVAS